MTRSMALKLAKLRKARKEGRKSDEYWKAKLESDLSVLDAQMRVSRPWAYPDYAPIVMTNRAWKMERE